jgi:hypothetical protein
MTNEKRSKNEEHSARTFFVYMFTRRKFEFVIDEEEEEKAQYESERNEQLNIKDENIQKKKDKPVTPAEKLNLTPSKVDFKFSFFAKKLRS